MARLLFLGTGSSVGVPVIGCRCETCTSSSAFNQRLRSSALLFVGEKNLLIDSSPDLRQQALKHKIERLDGVLYTHAHHDHTAGIDDLRVYHFINKKTLPCLASKETAEDLKARYSFMFKEQLHEHSQGARLMLQVLPSESGSILFQEVRIKYFSFYQTGMKINGFRFGDLAYVTDIKTYTEDIFEELKGVKTLILSALRFTPSNMHFSIDEAVDFAMRVGSTKTWLTHLAHELEYEKTNNYLPSDIRLGYDGLEIDFDEEKI